MRRTPLGPTSSEESPGGVVHGQRVDQLSACGEQRAPLEQGEGEGGVVRGDVQLQGGVDADEQVDGLDGQQTQTQRMDQGLNGPMHLQRVREPDSTSFSLSFLLHVIL